MSIVTKQQVLLDEITALLDRCDELDKKKSGLIKDVCAKLKLVQTLNDIEQEN
jgi:vacuolar-type H+-ATPase subunit D/Vma8